MGKTDKVDRTSEMGEPDVMDETGGEAKGTAETVTETAKETESWTYDAHFLHRWAHFEYNLCGPHGSGKTTLLRTLAAFYGGTDEDGARHIGADAADYRHDRDHPVIWLDFSDVTPTSFKQALAFIRYKMSELYIEKYSEIVGELDYREMERCLDVIEGTCGKKKLASSLRDLVHHYRFRAHDPGCERAIILIDEVTRPVLFAARYGFEREMRDFLNEFLYIDHYEMDAGFVSTSYAPANTAVGYGVRYFRNEPVNEHKPLVAHCRTQGIELNEPEDGQEWDWDRCLDQHMGAAECFESLATEMGDALVTTKAPKIKLDEATQELVANLRAWVAAERLEDERREREAKERERIEYAAPLAYDCDVPSRFAGARKLEMEVGSQEAREHLNANLRDIYVRLWEKADGDDECDRGYIRVGAGRYGGSGYCRELCSEDVYRLMQGFNEEGQRLRVGEVLKRLKARMEESGANWFRADTNGGNWGRVSLERFKRGSDYSDFALVKVYLTHRVRTQAPALFEDVVTHLIKTTTHRFHAKVGLVPRHDHICLWVARDDFSMLENYVRTIESDLVCRLPFIAYRGRMGISRELASWRSYNGLLSELVFTYLKGIDDPADIDVLDMYDRYVRAWNGDLPDDDPFTKEFKQDNAQLLLIALETLDVLLGNAEVDDACFLLSGDGNLMHMLGDARNWYEVGREFEYQRERNR